MCQFRFCGSRLMSRRIFSAALPKFGISPTKTGHRFWKVSFHSSATLRPGMVHRWNFAISAVPSRASEQRLFRSARVETRYREATRRSPARGRQRVRARRRPDHRRGRFPRGGLIAGGARASIERRDEESRTATPGFFIFPCGAARRGDRSPRRTMRAVPGKAEKTR